MSDFGKYDQELIDYLTENYSEFADYVAATGTPAQQRTTGGHEVRHLWTHTDKNGVRLHCFTNGHSYCLTTNAGVVISDEEPAVETDEEDEEDEDDGRPCPRSCPCRGLVFFSVAGAIKLPATFAPPRKKGFFHA